MGITPSKHTSNTVTVNKYPIKTHPVLPDIVKCAKTHVDNGKSCITHNPIKTECQTRFKLIEKGVYSVEKSKFRWKAAYYKINYNLPDRDPVKLKEFVEATYRRHRPMVDKCKQAHAIHCAIANHLNYRPGFYGFYS